MQRPRILTVVINTHRRSPTRVYQTAFQNLSFVALQDQPRLSFKLFDSVFASVHADQILPGLTAGILMTMLGSTSVIVRATHAPNGSTDCTGSTYNTFPGNPKAAVIDTAIIQQIDYAVGICAISRVKHHSLSENTLLDSCGACHLVNNPALLVPGLFKRNTPHNIVQTGASSFPISHNDGSEDQDEHFSDAAGGLESSSGPARDREPSAQSFGREAQSEREQQQPARSSRRIQKQQPDTGRNFVVQPHAQSGARTSRRLMGLPLEMSGVFATLNGLAKSSRRNWDEFTQTFVPDNHQWLGQESPGISQQ
ncbi:hypothetical protein BJ166DRAFT_622052 [Pestalotiopsis sp. NC0098]|nr:hypothetical protein BJ166DRAFT_622052 [Pestalotiopsis sp. NC0098]